MEESLLGSAKFEKVNTKAKGYGEALEESHIPTNQGLDVPVMKGNKTKNHRTCLGLINNKPKKKNGIKEKVCEK